MMNKNIYAIYHDVYVERCQKSPGGGRGGGEFFEANGLYPLTIFAKLSILDGCQGSEYAFVYGFVTDKFEHLLCFINHYHNSNLLSIVNIFIILHVLT